MITERFNICRKSELEELLQPDLMIKTWKKEVRPRLRGGNVEDLLDYLDFHENIQENIRKIKDSVLRGKYRTQPPFWLKEEKKLGVSRLMLMPSPEDALLLQSITNKLSTDLKNIQPVKNVFFSQLRHKPHKKLHEVQDDSGYSRSKLFKKYVEKSLGFARAGKYIVTTDIANFYDSILLSDLRHVVSHWFLHHEVELDLLFRILQDLSHQPDYLPPRQRGLPTIDLDAPRLLAHVYLFEVDTIIASLTKKRYTRWMDDIVFGAESYAEAKGILGDLNDVLRARGLSLNLQKTKIFKPTQYYKEVLYNENLYLDKCSKKIKDKQFDSASKSYFRKKWNNFLSQKHKFKSWNKVLKRYLGIGTSIRAQYIVNDVADLFFEAPVARPSIISYLVMRGYCSETEKAVKNIFQSRNLSEDVSLIQLVKGIAKWELPCDKTGERFYKYVNSKLEVMNSHIGRYSHIYFNTSYGSRRYLASILMKNISKFPRDSFYTRQMICCIPLVYNSRRAWANKVLESVAQEGTNPNSDLAKQILKNINSSFDLSRLKNYFFFNLNGARLKHSKLIYLCSCLAGAETDMKNDILIKALEDIKSTSQLRVILRTIEGHSSCL